MINRGVGSATALAQLFALLGLSLLLSSSPAATIPTTTYFVPSYDQVEQLYVQNPAFGFYFLRLASARLFQNIGTLEQRLAQQTALAAAKPA